MSPGSGKAHRSTLGPGMNPLQQETRLKFTSKQYQGIFLNNTLITHNSYDISWCILTLPYDCPWNVYSPLCHYPQQQTKSLCWSETWTTLTWPSSVRQSLMSMSWPTFSDKWTSRWFPYLTLTVRRCTALSQSSSCCSTKESMVCLFYLLI